MSSTPPPNGLPGLTREPIRTNGTRIRYRDRLSRLGLHFLFVALFAIIGGSLRGFNLLLLLAGLLISVVIVQWRTAHTAIRRVHLSRQPLSGGHVGDDVHIRYRVRNLSRFFPTAFVQIEESLVPVDAIDDDEKWSVFAATGSVAPQQSIETSVQCRFATRGAFQLGPLIASTTFPFALSVSERQTVNSEQTIYVYPSLLTLKRHWQRLLPPRPGGDGDRSTTGTNYQGEFYGLRPWQSGDHVRHIHWRTTARLVSRPYVNSNNAIDIKSVSSSTE
ncbi:hypothetical protein C2E31_14100 [Rhodopirellula baltica]|nr:hypothetical protein C2E31_14100 [Rhodopirellula baltica]